MNIRNITIIIFFNFKNIKENNFNSLIDKLSPLARYIDARENTSGPSKFNFEDELVAKEMVEFGPQNEAVSITRYKEMVEEKIKELMESNPILQRIVEGNTISQAEIEELANELHEENPHITIGLLRRVYQNRKAKFIQFIKHILGLEVLETFKEERPGICDGCRIKTTNKIDTCIYACEKCLPNQITCESCDLERIKSKNDDMYCSDCLENMFYD